MPPTIRKQSPTTRSPTGAAAGNRTPTSRPASGGAVWDSVDAVRMLLYGRSGTGKTTLWATFPAPIHVILCSGGNKSGELKSIDTPANRKRIVPTAVNTMTEVHAALDRAEGAATTVIDHTTGLADIALREILGLAKMPAQASWGLASQQQYGQQALHLKEAMLKALQLPGNVVFIAQERTFNGGDEGFAEMLKPSVGAAMSPSVTNWMNQACDYVAQTFLRPRMETVKRKVNGNVVETQERGKGVEYCLRVEPHEVYQTKFRTPGGVKADVIVNPTFALIQAVIKGETT